MADGVTEGTPVGPDGSESASTQTSAGVNAEGVKQQDAESPEDGHECSVCLQTCVHPVQLPCSHIFCFLCIKGVASHSKKCALCRSEIPPNFLFRPMLLNANEVLQTPSIDGKYQWFYEGARGWWQYDIRASAEIEDRYQKGELIFEMLIAGFLYIVDIENMIQYRRNTPSRRRRIKRDLANIPDKRGIAGLSYRLCLPKRMGGDGGERSVDQGQSSSQSNQGQSSGQSNQGQSSGRSNQGQSYGQSNQGQSSVALGASSSSGVAATSAVDVVQNQMASLSLADGGRVLREISRDGEDAGSRVTSRPINVSTDHQVANDQQYLRTRQTQTGRQGVNMSFNQTDTTIDREGTGNPNARSSSGVPNIDLNVTQPNLRSLDNGGNSSSSIDGSVRSNHPNDYETDVVSSANRGRGSDDAIRSGRAEIDGLSDSD